MKLFNPPSVAPTEEQHKIAYLTYMLEDIFYNYLLGINMVRTGKLSDNMREKIDGTKSLIEQDLKCIDAMFEKYSETNKPIWETIYSFEDFKREISSSLHEPHCGDCTCVCAPCCRCQAEELYKIPSTVTWCRCLFYKDKHQKCKEHQ